MEISCDPRSQYNQDISEYLEEIETNNILGTEVRSCQNSTIVTPTWKAAIKRNDWHLSKTCDPDLYTSVPPEWKKNSREGVFKYSPNTEGNPPKSWRLIVHNNQIQSCLRQLAYKIDEDFSKKEIILIGVLTGATYFLVDLSRSLSIPHTIHAIKVSSYGNKQTASEEISITGLSEDETCSFVDKHIIMIDELYDTGRTLHYVREYLQQFRPASVSSCVMFRKRKDSVKYKGPDYCCLDDLPDVWLVGYGLDDNGTKRGWTNLWAVPKPLGMIKSYDDELFESRDKHSELQRAIRVVNTPKSPSLTIRSQPKFIDADA